MVLGTDCRNHPFHRSIDLGVCRIWNQKAVQRKLDPIIQELEEALKMIDKSDNNFNE